MNMVQFGGTFTIVYRRAERNAQQVLEQLKQDGIQVDQYAETPFLDETHNVLAIKIPDTQDDQLLTGKFRTPTVPEEMPGLPKPYPWIYNLAYFFNASLEEVVRALRK